jgi:hypothetical protein
MRAPSSTVLMVEGCNQTWLRSRSSMSGGSSLAVALLRKVRRNACGAVSYPAAPSKRALQPVAKRIVAVCEGTPLHRTDANPWLSYPVSRRRVVGNLAPLSPLKIATAVATLCMQRADGVYRKEPCATLAQRCHSPRGTAPRRPDREPAEARNARYRRPPRATLMWSTWRSWMPV